MSATFLDRNKKKSLLAALLLFLRERKILVLLLLLVLMASTIFLGPSALFRIGFLAKWLGSGDKHSYGDLVAAFQAAKNKSAGGGAGWGAFFGQGGGASGGGAGAGSGAPSSLDFVKGSKSDLGQEPGAGAGGAGGVGSGAQTVAGIANPSNPKDNQGGDAVAVGDGDAGGEREGLVKSAFAGGFMNGLLGGAGSGDGASGAYVGKGFFSGKGGAAGTSNGLAQNGLSGVSAPSTPSSVKIGGGKSSLSVMNARRAPTGSQNGFGSGFTLGGNKAYTQLAEGAANTTMFGSACLGTACCNPPDCPSEYAATNSGAMYDGGSTSQSILTSVGGSGGSNSGGLLNSSVSVPPSNSGGTGGGGAAGDAQNMATCEGLVQSCAEAFVAPDGPVVKEGQDQKQLTAWFGDMANACGNPCNCGPCHDLQTKIGGLCSGDMATQTTAAGTPCPPLPDYCVALHFTNVDPPSASVGESAMNLCRQNVQSCGCTSLFCGIGCFFGS